MNQVLPPALPAACNDCPWRRESAPGWLGHLDAEGWVQVALSEEPIACHQTVKVDDDWTQPGVRQCYGAAVFRRHMCKVPRDGQVARAEPDPQIFRWYQEFLEHHQQHDTGVAKA